MSRDPRRASLPEVIGAWLRLWTPPRDVVVPPVPVRALVIGAVVAVLTIGAAAAVIVPAIDATKERSAERDRAERDARRAAERRRVIAEQRPRVLVRRDLRAPASAASADRLAARASLLAAAERAITADARRRVAAGELDGRPGTTECDPYPARAEGERPEQDLRVRTGFYNCLVVIREIPATETNPAGRLGYPFRAVLAFAAGRVTWCKTNPVPGEQVIPDPELVTELPAVCRRPA